MSKFTLSPKLKNILQKALPFAWCGAAFVGVLVCAFLVWYQYLTNVGNTTERHLINDHFNTTITLEEGVPISQEFESYMPMYEVGVYFERLNPDVTGTLSVQLQNLTTGEVLMDTVGNISTVYYDAYTTFALSAPTETWAGEDHYLLTITAYYATETNQLALKCYDESIDGFYDFTAGDTLQDGSLTMMITYDVLGGTPVRWYFILSVLFAVCAAVLCYLCFFAKGKLSLAQPWLAFLIIFTVGVFYQFALPAYSTPDELSHYDAAYSISNKWLGLTPQTEGATLVKRSTDAQYTFVDYNTDAFTYRYIAENFFAAPDGTYVEEDPVLIGLYALPYYLSAAGLTLGQLLNWSGIFTTFFARGLNLLFFAGMVALSIYFAPFGKKIFAAVALLPIALHVGGSFSYDSCLLSLSFFILALGLRLIFGEGRINWFEVALFILACILVGPLKSAYFPLTFLALLIPTARFAKKWQAYLIRLGAPAASLLHFAIHNYTMVLVQVRVDLDLDLIAEEINAGAVDVSPYTLMTLLSYPGAAFKLVVNTFFTNFTSYVVSMLGGTLGYQDLAEVNLDLLIVAAFAVLLMFACIKHKGEFTLPALHRCTLGFSALCVLGILVIACFSWTLITYDVLWGFQGRYLLPALGFALFAMQPTGVATEKDTFPALLYAGFALNFLALLNVISITFLR